MNKSVAGYHMLMILSQVDGHFDKKEEKIIASFIKSEFNFINELDSEIVFLNELKYTDFSTHFYKAMDEFYKNSTLEERNSFLNFAMKLVKADMNISRNENIYLTELFNAWENQE